MKIFEIFQKRDTEIGKFECTRDNLANILVGLMERMGMSNPGKVISASSKAVTIQKKGDKYIITLNTFVPPLKLEWTGVMDINEILDTVDAIIAKQRKIAYVNTFNDATGSNTFQFALA